MRLKIIIFFFFFEVILVEIKDNTIVTKMELYYYFPEIVDILYKLWIIIFKHVELMPRNMNN